MKIKNIEITKGLIVDYLGFGIGLLTTAVAFIAFIQGFVSPEQGLVLGSVGVVLTQTTSLLRNVLDFANSDEIDYDKLAEILKEANSDIVLAKEVMAEIPPEEEDSA